MPITASDFRNGVTFEMDGQVMQVVEFQHVKPGKGAAFVRTKMKNVITGGVTETSFNPTAKFEQEGNIIREVPFLCQLFKPLRLGKGRRILGVVHCF